MQTNALVLALDIGTSSLRTALFDARGRRLGKTTAQEKYVLRMEADGTAELAVRDLEEAALRALRKTLLVRRQTPKWKDRPIVAVGASCFWHSLLGYDAKRGKTTPIFTWEDSRCHVDAASLRMKISEHAYQQRTGCLLRTPYWPAKLHWLHRTGRARGVTAWMSPAEWLYGRLAGAASVSLSMASGTGLLDLRRGAWDRTLCRRLGLAETLLGTISDEPFSVVDAKPILPALHRFPELRQARWFPALGDGAAGNLGSDAVDAGRAAMNVGTSGALRSVLPRLPRKIPPGLFCYRVDARRYLLGGAISNAGNLRAWAVQQLRLPDTPAALERALSLRPGPSPGLAILPFWAKERSPTWPPDAGGTIAGLTYATTALDLLQAAVESTYHRLAQIADLLEATQKTRFKIVVSGGVRHSSESLQRLANILGRPIRPCAEPEASLRGAAVHALQRLGAKTATLPLLPLISSQPNVARLFREARLRQEALEQRMSKGLRTVRRVDKFDTLAK